MKNFRSIDLLKTFVIRSEKGLLSARTFLTAAPKRQKTGINTSRSRRLTLETLEERRLLTAVPGTVPEWPLSGASGKEIIVTTLTDDPEDTEISLQEAVDQAKSGDTITFAAALSGQTITLTEELSVTQNITIDASGLAGGITIDAQENCRLFSISGGTLEKPIQLINLTLTGGKAEHGAGIYCSAGYLQVTGCTISGNTAAGFGGGIYNLGTLSITGIETSGSYSCSIQSNKANYGGGIYNSGSLTIDGASITRNEAAGEEIEMEQTVILLTGMGGGIYNTSVMSIDNSEVTLNTAAGIYSLGGGIYNEGRGTVNCCTISGNTAVMGGGFCCSSPESFTSTFNLSNSLVIQNKADGEFAQGGGISHIGGDAVITNCTIAANTVSGTETQKGGGIFTASENITLYNTIIVTNTADGEVNDIQQNPYQEKGKSVYGVISGYHNLSAFSGWTASASEGNRLYNASQKLFTNAPEGDYTLCSGSQGLDWGDNQYAAGSYDLAQNHRISHKIVDIGAYELQVVSPHLEKIEVSTSRPTYSAEEAATITTVITPADREVTYQWYRGISPNAEDMSLIDGAAGSTYQVTEYDLGFYLMVTATESGEEEPVSVAAFTGKVLPTVPEVWLNASEYTVQEGGTVCFSGNSDYNFYDNLIYYWDFSGSETEKAENFAAGDADYYLKAENLPFAADTPVPIRMYAVDEYGHKSETVSAVLTVYSVKPSVTFTPAEFLDGQILKLSLNFLSVHPETITQWTVFWGDGSKLLSASTAARLQTAHYYKNPGSYTITLTIAGEAEKTLFNQTLLLYTLTVPVSSGLMPNPIFAEAGTEDLPSICVLFAPETETNSEQLLLIPENAASEPLKEPEPVQEVIFFTADETPGEMDENWDFLNEETLSSYKTEWEKNGPALLDDGEWAVFL